VDFLQRLIVLHDTAITMTVNTKGAHIILFHSYTL